MMTTPPTDSARRMIVYVDRELEDIIPVFLSNRRKDLAALRTALADKDFETIRVLGHRMKGDGGGYGFDRITEIGGAMELAAARRDYPALDRHVEDLDTFLTRVEVVYR
jgi:HPt (histidine-containing phosphotransfer) domain-containing protein